MSIDISFLGTSQAIPTKTRNHTAILLSYKSENILIDCGEGTQRQFRKLDLNPGKVTKILLTHWHGDHVLGLPGLFQTLALSGYNKKMKIYGPRGTKKYMKELTASFIPVLKFEAEVFEVKDKVFFENKDFQLQAYSLEHGKVPVNGYKFIEKNKLRIDKKKLKKLNISRDELSKLSLLTSGKSIKINKKTITPKQLTYQSLGKSVSFIFDTKVCPKAKSLAKNSDLAIMESTYANEEEELAKEYGHMSAGQAATIAKQSNVKKLILTHISQRYQYKDKILETQAKQIFKNTEIAQDLMKLTI
ncbi:ribonuclease Z [Candidatus Pacearchaeota archaeon]|nr:ribonuclease Z [Candidatus Pacearchaeota archaeon]